MRYFIAGTTIFAIIPLLWMAGITMGALIGWGTVAFLSLVFTFDYDAMRQIALVLGGVMPIGLAFGNMKW